MKQRKAPVGAIEVTMAGEEFNTLLAVLDEIIVCGADTKLGFYAKRLKKKCSGTADGSFIEIPESR